MGEENKDEAKKGAEGREEKKEEPPEIVLKVDMHCEACARKIARALKGFEGVEDVTTDSKASKVVVKGKMAEPIKICERLQRKSGRKVEIISPLPEPHEESKEDENKQPKEEKKEEPPAVVTVVLNIRMHCEACAQRLQKQIRKVKGVESVETDLASAKVTVKGVIDPEKLVGDVYKKTRKHVSIVKEEEKKEEEKKEEEKEGEKKAGGEDKVEDDKKSTEIKRFEYLPSIALLDYAYPPQIFSDENPNACSVM
ncbi:hypothetical protein K2173_018070 [Erythroxylum novogranatense]|uniref:HMA domain-containing protein n=1 Tax=Erythroxylum novogranatense TaxID=1862640 RepID=A0AAV8TXH8_9ROSI|nr:hypothetical protein K2173_018070 [Erythroxylum novogranatense]